MTKKKKRGSAPLPDLMGMDPKTRPAGSKERPQRSDNEAAKLIAKDDRLIAGCLLLVIALVPLLVRLKVIDFTSPRLIATYLDTGLHGAFFTYYKLLLIVVAAMAVIALLIRKMLAYKYILQPSYINIPLLILVLTILISLLAAEYKSIALLGIYSQGDGALVWLAWMALCLAAANTVYKPGFSRGVNIALLIFTGINTILMLGYFFGYRWLDSSMIRTLVAPAELHASLQGGLESTLNNLNYVSGFGAALFAYFMGGVFLYEERRPRWVAFLGGLGAFIMVLASLSSSGFVTLLLLIPLLGLVVWRSADRGMSIKAGTAVLAGCVIIFLLMNAHNPRVGEETIGFLQGQKPTVHQQESGGVEFTLNQQRQVLTQPEAQYSAGGRETETALTLNNQQPVSAGAEPQELQQVTPITPEQLQLPQPAWSAGTGRVYIWQETIKLTLERLWTGYGPGTLPYYFPHNDINKIAGLNSYSTLITKPHNAYLGIAFGLGIPALLALLTLFLLHFYHIGRYLWQSRLSQPAVFPLALFLFCWAFAVQGLFNDVVIDAGAIFWILLGVGVSLNRESERTTP